MKQHNYTPLLWLFWLLSIITLFWGSYAKINNFENYNGFFYIGLSLQFFLAIVIIIEIFAKKISVPFFWVFIILFFSFLAIPLYLIRRNSLLRHMAIQEDKKRFFEDLNKQSPN